MLLKYVEFTYFKPLIKKEQFILSNNMIKGAGSEEEVAPKIEFIV